MTPARRAAILLLVFGGLAAFAGVGIIATAPKLAAEMTPPPELQEQLAELKRQNLPVDLRTLLVISGVMLLVYAVVAVVMGVLVRGAGRATVIITLILAAIVTAIAAIQAGARLVVGMGAEAIFSAGVAIAHGMVIKWMILTLKSAAPAAAPLFQAARKPPLADYYIPPAPPESLA